jgi:hypothetical protein
MLVDTTDSLTVFRRNNNVGAPKIALKFSYVLNAVTQKKTLHLLPRSRMVELYLHSPICLHGTVLN